MSNVSITQLQNGTTADATVVDANFNAIAAVLNGGIDTSNFASTGIITQPYLDTNLQQGWIPTLETWSYGANNGNKEFTVTVSGDKTGKYNPGMKVKIPRGVTPPTQAMSFTAASTQYATKASPTGITFTGPFTVEAWVYLNSYGTGEPSVINRRNSTFNGGWGFSVSSSALNDGRVRIYYGTGTSATDFISYQILPLRQWVHIAGVVTSVSGKTGQIYINGVAVTTTSVTTAATSLTQSTDDLRLGAISGTPASTYFDGYMSEVRVWSGAQTQTQIQANMGINCVGNETNLVALFQGNGNFNDLTSNANNLTATNGATSVTANPYHATEYGLVVGASYSNPTTTLTINTGGSVLPNQTLGAASYSLVHEPFGFPLPITFTMTIYDSNVASRLLGAGVNVVADGIKVIHTATVGGTWAIQQVGNTKTITLMNPAGTSLAANAAGNVVVTFPLTFASAPMALAAAVPSGDPHQYANTTGASTTGDSVYVVNMGTLTLSPTFTFMATGV